MIFSRARYYSPVIGRFTGEDRSRFLTGPNIYAYVANNPVSFTDPSGLQLTVPPSPIPPPSDPPAGCSSSAWKLDFSSDPRIVSEQGVWEKFDEMEIGIAGRTPEEQEKEEERIREAWEDQAEAEDTSIGCICSYHLIGIRQVWFQYWIWSRVNVCQPCPLSEHVETQWTSKLWEGYKSVDSGETMKIVAPFNESQNKCDCPEHL